VRRRLAGRFLGCSRSGPECAFRVLATSYCHIRVRTRLSQLVHMYGLQYGIEGAVMFTDSVFQTCGTH
jgi:hypothetical protein